MVNSDGEAHKTRGVVTKMRHTNRLRRGILIGVILFSMLFMCSFASAWEFDNVKSYDSATKTITIKDSILGIPTTEVAKITLDSPQVNLVPMGNDIKVAELTFDNKEDNYQDFIKSMETYDGKSMEALPEQRKFVYRLKETYDEDVIDYITDCKDTGEKDAKNGSIIYACNPKEIGTHKKTKTRYTSFDEKNPLPIGKITLGIFTEVKQGDYVEWIPTLYGVRINEWAAWSQSTSVGLVAYYRMDDSATSQTNAVDSTKYKMADVGTGNYHLQVGQYNFSDLFYPNSYCVNNTGAGNLTINDYPFTMSGWIRFNSTNADDTIFFMGDGTGSSAMHRIGISGTSKRICAGSYTNANVWICDNVDRNDNKWHLYTGIWNATKISLFVDGAFIANGNPDTYFMPTGKNINRIAVGGMIRDSPGDYYTGYADDFGIWNRSLSEAEILALNSTTRGYEPPLPPAAPPITITPTLITTKNSTQYNNYFNSTATITNGNMTNATLYIWNGGEVTNTTTFSAGTNNTAGANLTYYKLDGTYTWNYLYCGTNISSAVCTWGATNKSMTIDSIVPNVIIKYPLNTTYAYNVSGINFTALDTNLDSCWYSTGNGNTTTASCANLTGLTSVEGTNIWRVSANDTFGNINTTTVMFFKDTVVPSLVIEYPKNTTYNYLPTDINFSASDANNLSCYYGLGDTVYIWNEIFCNQNFTGNLYLAEGRNVLNVRAEDFLGNVNTSIIEFQIDTIQPAVSITSPLANVSTLTLSYNVSMATSISDAHLDTCLYSIDGGATNITYDCVAQNVTITSGGTYTINVYANDTFGNSASSSVSYFLNHIKPVLNITTPVLEGDRFNVYFNVTANSIYQTNASVNYNGNVYPMALISNSGTLAQFYKNLTAPSVVNDTEYNISIRYNVNNEERTTNNQTQLVYKVQGLTVTDGACNFTAYTFTMFDEENFTAVTGTMNYNFVFGYPGNTSMTNSYGNLSGVNKINVCFNNTLSSSWNVSYGEIQYSAPGYPLRRFYLFSNVVFTDSATINNSLYLLQTASATPFSINVLKNDLTPLAGYYTTLLRWYPQLNEYKIVEMGKTDSLGHTVNELKIYDTDYRFGVYQTDGTLIKLFSPARLVCSSAPCTYNLYIDLTNADYSSFYDTQNSLTYNATTKIVTFIWNDPTQSTDEMNLTVYNGDNPVCSQSVSSFTGVMTCNLSAYSGVTLRAMAYRTASPQAVIASKFIEIRDILSDAVSGSAGLIVAIAFAAILFLIGAINPIISIVLGVVALLPAYFLGAISLEVGIGFGIIGGLIIYTVIKRSG